MTDKEKSIIESEFWEKRFESEEKTKKYQRYHHFGLIHRSFITNRCHVGEFFYDDDQFIERKKFRESN